MTTTISPRSLACRVYRAFRRGDLADMNQLKDALACGNYLDSGSSRPFVAGVFHGLDVAVLTKLPVKSASVSIAAADHCRGEPVPCAGKTFFWTETNDWEGELPDRPGASWQRDPIRRQLLAYAKDWLQRKRRAAVWLSDFAGSELMELSAPHLMADLGRLDAQANRRRRVVVFTVKIIAEHNVYKPTMVDSGFTYYWRAWPSSTEHGMTRSLRDNRAVYREWVVSKAHVEIIDVWPLPVADVSLCESDLDGAFWQACRREIEDRRTKEGL